MKTCYPEHRYKACGRRQLLICAASYFQGISQRWAGLTATSGTCDVITLWTAARPFMSQLLPVTQNLNIGLMQTLAFRFFGNKKPLLKHTKLITNAYYSTAAFDVNNQVTHRKMRIYSLYTHKIANRATCCEYLERSSKNCGFCKFSKQLQESLG